MAVKKKIDFVMEDDPSTPNVEKVHLFYFRMGRDDVRECSKRSQSNPHSVKQFSVNKRRNRIFFLMLHNSKFFRQLWQ